MFLAVVMENEACLPLIKIQQKMSELKEWGLEGNAIVKEKKFNSFREALEYVNKVGEIAEMLGHHPDILLLEDSVRVTLLTKKYNCITEKDFEMAKKIDEIE